MNTIFLDGESIWIASNEAPRSDGCLQTSFVTANQMDMHDHIARFLPPSPPPQGSEPLHLPITESHD